MSSLSNSFAIRVLFTVFLLFHGNAWGETSLSKVPPDREAYPDILNVKVFGALGDGKADDTEAIQRAVNAANEIVEKQTVRVKHWRHIVSGINAWAPKAIVFPPGHYRISKPIVFTKPVSIWGVGNAEIEQINTSQDIFYFSGMRIASIQGLTFRGGNIQLRFWTNNLDQTRVNITDCSFIDSGGFAVECWSYSKQKFTGKSSEFQTIKPWAPYTINWTEGLPTLTANSAKDLGEWFNSTLLTISKSEFIGCMGVADMQCDTAVIENSRIETNSETDGPIIRIPSGKTHLYRVNGLAHLNSKKDAYWIQGGGIVSVRECDFNTDGNVGIDFIRVLEPTHWVSLQIGYFCIEIENTRLKVNGSRHNAICWFSKGNQPSILSYRGITETSGESVEAAVWEVPPTKEVLQGLLPPNNPLVIPTWFHIQFVNNSQNITLNLPDILAPALETPIPSLALNKVHIEDMNWGFHDLKKDIAGVVFVKVPETNQDRKEDCSDAIQKAFDEAGKLGKSLVIFPSGIFRITRPIKLPPKVIVEAGGVAIIIGTNSKQTLFTVDNPKEIAFQGFLFEGGEIGFDLVDTKKSKGRIAFLDCSFYDQREIGIRYLSDDNENQNEVSIIGGNFGVKQMLVTNALHAEIRQAWIVNDPHLNDAAFIENRGGNMKVIACLGVPKLWSGSQGKQPEVLKSWDFSRNVRWIDNFGRLEVCDVRFGGESGGMANIFHRAEGGSVFVQGGTYRFNNDASKRSLLYLEMAPEAVVLQNISSIPVSIKDSTSLLTNAKINFDLKYFSHAGLLAPLPPKVEGK